MRVLVSSFDFPGPRIIEERERGASWMSFKREVLEEFRDDDEEQHKYTEGYLSRTVARMEKSGSGLAEYRAFILDFCEKARVLVQRGTINEHMRVTLFLAAFSDKIGDELCKKCEIDLDNPATTQNVFSNLRKEVLAICANEDSQMKKRRKQMSVYDAEREKPKEKEKEKERKRKVDEKKVNEKPKDDIDDLANMMKDLKIYQLEA